MRGAVSLQGGGTVNPSRAAANSMSGSRRTGSDFPRRETRGSDPDAGSQSRGYLGASVGELCRGCHSLETTEAVVVRNNMSEESLLYDITE